MSTGAWLQLAVFMALLLALAWLLAKEEITSVLVGASRPSQILDNIKAVENTGFTAEELAEIDRLSV